MIIDIITVIIITKTIAIIIVVMTTMMILAMRSQCHQDLKFCHMKVEGICHPQYQIILIIALNNHDFLSVQEKN